MRPDERHPGDDNEETVPRGSPTEDAPTRPRRDLVRTRARPADPDASGHTEPAGSRRASPVGGDSAVGQVIGGCRIVRRIGKGSMGEVFEARQESVQNRRVALKLMLAKHVLDDEFEQRFRREAGAAGRLETPYVISVFNFGNDGPRSFLVMEYASGGNLADYREQFEDGRIPVPECVRLMTQAAEGLLAAERNRDDDGNPQQLIHRDIKPANLLLSVEGGAEQGADIRIADFGAAKLADVDQTVGQAPLTPRYASPEQWNTGTRLDHRSDMYSLGATFFRLATGAYGADGEEISQVRAATLDQPFLDPDKVRGFTAALPDEHRAMADGLRRVLMKMTARNRDHRYASFEQVITHLRQIASGASPRISPPPHPRRLAASALAAVALLATAGGLEWAGVTDWIPGAAAASEPTIAERRLPLRSLEQRIRTALGPTDPEAIEPLREPLARALDAVELGMRQLGTAERDGTPVAASWASAPELSATHAVDRRLRQLHAARAAVAALTEVEQHADERSIAHSQAALDALTLGEVDGPVGDHLRERLARARSRVAELQSQRRQRLAQLTESFRTAAVKPAQHLVDVQAYLAAMRDRGETSLGAQASALARQVRAAQDDEAVIADAWPAQDDEPTELATFADALRELAQAVPVEEATAEASDPYDRGALVAWRRARLLSLSADWRERLGRSLRRSRQRCEAKIYTAATQTEAENAGAARREKQAFEHVAATVASSLTTAAATAVFTAADRRALETQLSTGLPAISFRTPEEPPVVPPLTWPDDYDAEMRALWPETFRPVPGVAMRHEGDVVLWRLPGRDVDMVLVVDDTTAFLVDRTEVTIGEYRSRLTPKRLPGGWEDWRNLAGLLGDLPDDALLFSMSYEAAQEFALRGYTGHRFALMTPEQWDLARGPASGTPTAEVAVPDVASVLEDVAPSGVAGLRSGLGEYLASPGARARWHGPIARSQGHDPSDAPREAPKNVTNNHGIGFRLVYNLEPRNR